MSPRFHAGKKAASYTFLGEGSVSLLRDCIKQGVIEAGPETRLIPRSYYGIWAAIHRASRRVGLDSKIQTCHGFRKYFENALDDASIDHEKKMIIEGHFAGARARHYTDRDVEQLRNIYAKSYHFIQVEPAAHPSSNERESEMWNKFAEIERQMAQQRVLEAKLVAPEDKLRQMKEFHRQASFKPLGTTASSVDDS